MEITAEKILATRFNLSDKDATSGPLIKAVLTWLHCFGGKEFQIMDIAYSLNSSERAVYRALAILRKTNCVAIEATNSDKRGQTAKVIGLPLSCDTRQHAPTRKTGRSKR